jgi:uncharacterized cupredoxin-like copper-binding protein
LDEEKVMNTMRLRLVGGVALLAAIVMGVLAGTAVSAPATKTTVVPTKITVSAYEFSFKLSKVSILKPGTVVFTVINKGKIAHDFDFPTLKKTTRLLQPGQKQLLTVKFTKKGSFYYLCTVPRHAQEGMAGSFKVK